MKQMKRIIKEVIDWLINRYDWEQIVGFAISGVVAIVLAIMLFVTIDKVPATPSDYENLEEQVNTIQQNPDLLLEKDYNINVNSGVITVEFWNDECKMTAKYDKDFEVLSTSKEDNSMFWLYALIIALIFGAGVFYIGGWILAILILLIEVLVEWISIIVLKIKTKFQKK